MTKLNVMDQPFPEPERLVWGLSTRKIPTPCLDPEQQTHRAGAFHSAPASSDRKIRIDDVSYLLGGFSAIAHRSVGSPLEPLRMVLAPGVIR